MPDVPEYLQERWTTRRWARTPGQRGRAVHLIHPDKPGTAECDGRELADELPDDDRSPGCRACLDADAARVHKEWSAVLYGPASDVPPPPA